MDMLHTVWSSSAIQTVVTEPPPIDFIFDEMINDKRAILDTWDQYVSSRNAGVRSLYGARPIFADDTEFLPLQAADLWIWYRRRWYENNEEPMSFWFWEKTKGKPQFAVDISFSEDNIVEALTTVVRGNLGPFITILDRKTGRVI